MMQTPEYEAKALDALTRAVVGALERKRRLGQYAVVWRGDRPVCIGPDAPADCDQARSEPDRSLVDVAESGREINSRFRGKP